ncbi:MAG: TetR/AcrR family transcriptional regulator [Verrucomicrobiota bacterium]
MVKTVKKRESKIRRSILTAAEKVLVRDGVKALSQTRVAEVAGVRQSHLTYYFPKKPDLISGLLKDHVAQMETALDNREESTDIGQALDVIARDAGRMRFFLGLIVECERDKELRRLLGDHVRQFDRLVERYFQREPGDEDVRLFLNTLRGCGLMSLLHHEPTEKNDPARIAERFGLNFSG